MPDSLQLPDALPVAGTRPDPPLVVIGTSAGGIEALITLLGGLQPGFPAAVCIVLHLSPHTPSNLAKVLQPHSALPVRAAADGDVLEAGRIYTPTADRHMMIDGNVIRLTRGPRECRTRPAIDVLFRSAAVAKGADVVGVVLTGMLDDGTAGLWAVKDRGGQALVESPETAQYPSMPRSARAHVAVDAALPIEQMAAELTLRTRRMRTNMEQSDAAPSDGMAVEVSIAAEGNGLRAGVMDLGKVSSYTCPDCHGVLVEIVDGSVTRFRCHTGHAYSIKTLLSDVNEAIDLSLWATLRAIEERAMLLEQWAAMATQTGDLDVAQDCRTQAANAMERAETIRSMVLDAKLFGHTPREE